MLWHGQSMIEDTGPGVKASTKFVERIAKHPDEWN
jgi:hypothetical protein